MGRSSDFFWYDDLNHCLLDVALAVDSQVQDYQAQVLDGCKRFSTCSLTDCTSVSVRNVLSSI